LHGDGGKKARSPESTKETVKTIARGMPGVSGVTVLTTLVCFSILLSLPVRWIASLTLAMTVWLFDM
jgi:energy-converting hydrogenase Eha subunit G